MGQLRTRIAAFAAMALCCGAAMSIALGLFVLTGAWLVGGAIALIVASCVGTAGWMANRTRHNSNAHSH